MILGPLTHPLILDALGRSGHGARILVADGNYPFRTASPAGARRVYLNLRRGLVQVTDVLETLIATVPLEAATVMRPESGPEPAVFQEFRTLLPGVELEAVERHRFYDLARDPNVDLVVATGEQRVYANVLLTIGVVGEGEGP